MIRGLCEPWGARGGWAGRSPARLVRCRWWSGGRAECDVMSEGLQLLYEVAGSAVGVDAAGVVVGAEVAEACRRVGEQVPDDDEDRAGDGDDRSQLASPANQAPIPLTQERVGPSCRGGGFSEHTFEIGIAFAGPAGAGARPGLHRAGGQLGPRHEMSSGGELGHVEAHFGDDRLGGDTTDTGDLIETLDHAETAKPREDPSETAAGPRAAGR